MDIAEISIIHHVAIVLVLLWILSSFNCCHIVVYFISLIYLYQIHDRYIMKMRRKLQYEERKQANQRRVLSDSETVRWLNHAVEKIWPICMEQIASQKILLPIIPWFLEKYKPWTAKEAVVQHMYLGRNPPMFTEIRALRQCADDDHLVLELGMNFLSADDMSTIIAVKLRKRLGFGMWAKLHITGMHVEGKVLVGVKFLRDWPFLGRLRLCFVEPPYFQMTVKPIFTHGLDVTELPGIAGWLDKLLAVAFEQTLVEPNMVVVDLEKFVAAPKDGWFSVDEKEPIAYARVEVLEGADMKPSDLNGLADPYIKGQLGSYRFQTKIQRKTLSPIWQEEFKIPICKWESSHMLALEVRDKDHFIDDTLGECSLNIGDLRDGQRRDMWLPLQKVKTGRLHLAVTVVEVNGKGENKPFSEDAFISKDTTKSVGNETAQKGFNSILTTEKAPKMADKFEPIDIDGQKQTGIWVLHPGTDVSQTWEPRKGKSRQLDTNIRREDNESIGSPHSVASGSLHNDSSSDENPEGKRHPIRRTLRNISSLFHRSPRKEDRNSSLHRSSRTDTTSPTDLVTTSHVNLRAEGDKRTGVKLIVEDSIFEGVTSEEPKEKERLIPDKIDAENPSKGEKKGMARSVLNHAGKSAHNIKQALSWKGSNHSKGDSGLTVTETQNSDRSNSSDEGSLSSATIPIESTPISTYKKESPITKDKNDKMSQCDSSKSIEDPLVKEDVQAEKTDDDMSNCSGIHEGLVYKSSNSNLSQGTPEAEKA